jgi:hypothetical protein
MAKVAAGKMQKKPAMPKGLTGQKTKQKIYVAVECEDPDDAFSVAVSPSKHCPEAGRKVEFCCLHGC